MVLEEVGTAATLLVIQPTIGYILIEWILIIAGIYAKIAGTKERNNVKFAHVAIMALPLTLLIFLPAVVTLTIDKFWVIPLLHIVLFTVMYVSTIIILKIHPDTHESQQKEWQNVLEHLNNGDHIEIIKNIGDYIIGSYVIITSLMYILLATKFINQILAQIHLDTSMMYIVIAGILTAAVIETYSTVKDAKTSVTKMIRIFLNSTWRYTKKLLISLAIIGIAVVSWYLAANIFTTVTKIATKSPIAAFAVQTDKNMFDLCVVNDTSEPIYILKITASDRNKDKRIIMYEPKYVERYGKLCVPSAVDNNTIAKITTITIRILKNQEVLDINAPTWIYRRDVSDNTK